MWPQIRLRRRTLQCQPPTQSNRTSDCRLKGEATRVRAPVAAPLAYPRQPLFKAATSKDILSLSPRGSIDPDQSAALKIGAENAMNTPVNGLLRKCIIAVIKSSVD